MRDDGEKEKKKKVEIKKEEEIQGKENKLFFFIDAFLYKWK